MAMTRKHLGYRWEPREVQNQAIPLPSVGNSTIVIYLQKFFCDFVPPPSLSSPPLRSQGLGGVTALTQGWD